jgi:hypothetical protein
MANALGRADIEIGRGTLASWIIRPAQLHYSRLWEALRRTLLSQSLIHGDETTVQVLKEPGRAAQSTSYIWVSSSRRPCRSTASTSFGINAFMRLPPTPSAAPHNTVASGEPPRLKTG